MELMDSILDSIKKVLGIEPEYTQFDEDIIMHINTVFGVLNQLGIGPAEGFMIEDNDATWDEYINTANKLIVKTYIAQRVRLMFDPPSTGPLLDAINRSILELEWRLELEGQNN